MTRDRVGPGVRSWFPFVLGALFVAVPTVGAFLSDGLGRRRRLVGALFAAATVAFAFYVSDSVSGGRSIGASAAAAWPWIAASLAWLVGRRVAGRRQGSPDVAIDRFVIGLVAAMVSLSVLALVQRGLGGGRAVGLLDHPNVLGASALALVGLVDVVGGRGRSGVVGGAWIAAAVLVGASGSRSALLGLAVLGLGRWLRCRSRPDRRIILAGAVILALVLGLNPRLRDSLDLGLGPEQVPHNLAAASERLDRWPADGVVVEGVAEPAQEGARAFLVTKSSPDPWRRPVVIVPIRPHVPYVVSVDVRSDLAEGRPGIEGWGRDPSTGDVVHVRVALHANGVDATAVANARILAAGAESLGSWVRIWVAFASELEGRVVSMAFGPTPDQRPSLGVQATFARFQVELGASPSAYVAGLEPQSEATGAARSRLTVWRVAWAGFLERPWLGWGSGTFAASYQSRAGQVRDLATPPAHAHSFGLQVLFERGLALGLPLFGLVTFAVWSARRDRAAVATAIALLVANAFDATLLTDVVAVPLAAALGWASVSGASSAGPVRRDDPAAGDPQRGRQRQVARERS